MTSVRTPIKRPPLSTTRPSDPVYTAPEDPARTDRAGSPVFAATAASGSDSAMAFIRDTFNEVFGGALNEFVQQAWVDYNSGKPIGQILFELRATPQYAARFPGMKALRDAGRPISETTYLDLERTYAQTARQFDLPPGFYDSPDDFGRLIGGEVSPAEWQRRLGAWQAAERDSRDPAAAAEIARQFAAAGLAPPSDGDYLTAFIDPTRGVAAIEQRLSAARIGTEAVRGGFGQIDVSQALTLADQGVTADQARAGFTALGGSQELFGALPGEQGFDLVNHQDQVGAVFGTDASARRRIEAQRRRRLADFSGGGQVGGGRTGLAGLGSAG